MRVGLGTGSTAVWAIRRIGDGSPTARCATCSASPPQRPARPRRSASASRSTTLDDHPCLDVTIDGADEVSPRLDLVKGGGGAHLREKIVAQASLQLVVVVDEAKLVPALGTGFAVPVEVVPMALRPEQGFLEALGARVAVRTAEDGSRFVTDEGNHILDADFGPLAEPAVLLEALRSRAGVVEVGLFLDMASFVVVARADGEVAGAGAAHARVVTSSSPSA